MANCPPSGCYDNWGDFGGAALCSARKEAGINAAIIFRCGVTRADIIDDENNDTISNDKVEALLSTDRAKLISGVQITLNAPSELTAPSGNPCVGDTAINYDRSLTWQDYNVSRERNEAYNILNAAKGFVLGGALLKHCASDMLTYIEGDIKFNGGRQSPEQSSEAQFFEFNVTWRNKDAEEIFEQSIDAFA